jgi:3-oxoadipate enol-lactonase
MLSRPLDDATLFWREDGSPDGAPVVLLHALGVDHSLWNAVVPLLPQGLRIVRPDMRGHGQSSVPPAPYKMGTLVSDAERIMDLLGLRDAVVVGSSIGGMIAQGLAAKRLDLVRGLCLANTAAKIGTPATWGDRIAQVHAGGIAAIAEPTLARWFPPRTRNTPAAWRIAGVLAETSPEGYAGCAAAIAGTDFYTTTAALTLPTLVVAGSADGSTPPDLVRETAGLIRGARYEMIRGAGHLPMIDRPEEFARLLAEFLRAIAHP